MHYTSLQLKNFRSYKEFSVELSKGVNIVVGPNASGKTNLLESILVASRGSSFRANDRALVMHGSEWLRIQAATSENHNRSITIKLVDEDKTQHHLSA
jgi:DNA replication and repair protein RecF